MAVHWWDDGPEWWDFSLTCWDGCAFVKRACKNCYAKGLLQDRLKKATWSAPRQLANTDWHKPVRWARRVISEDWSRRAIPFLNPDSDCMDADVPPIWRSAMWRGVERNCHGDLLWMWTTKRPENFSAMLPGWAATSDDMAVGVSVGDQADADEFIPLLLDAPAKLIWVSNEPALGPVDFRPYLRTGRIGMVIAGGERAPKGEACVIDFGWARSVRDQCGEHGVAFFMKQASGYGAKQLQAIPEDLRIRQFPQSWLLRRPMDARE